MGRRGNVNWKESEILAAIEKGKTAQQIIDNFKISRGTLKNKIFKYINEKGKNPKCISDITEQKKPPKISKNGMIFLSRGWISDDFNSGDELAVSYPKKGQILISKG